MVDSHKNNNILYELLVYSEWIQDPDILKLAPKKNEQSSLPRSALGFFKKGVSLTEEIYRVLSWQLPWKFAAGELGKVVAVLQDSLLEIRTSRDEYSSVVGKAIVAKDNMPQWRRLAWSPDCSMLAVGSSNGSIHFYDLLGSNLFNIPPINEGVETNNWSSENALACIMFISSRTKNPKWSNELLLVDYAGRLRSYFVSPIDSSENHTFTLSKSGVAAVAWHPAHNLIFVASLPDNSISSFKENGVYWGLTAWRLINDYPYYRLAVPTPEELEKAESQRGIWNLLPSIRSSQQLTIVFRMQISPKGNYLACLHTCGSISVWHLPNLKKFKMWKLEQQADCRVLNPADNRSIMELNLDDAQPIDLNWWLDEKLIIARRNGAVSVCELNGLVNLLGDSPEFLCGEPALSTTCTERGFLALECDMQMISSKRRPQQPFDQESSSDDEESSSILNQGSALVQSTVYFVTDMERFRPKRKRPKMVQRSYRLLGLKSTTPEELFTRKIDNEEYGEALTLAHSYSLDCDRVYQRQWRNSPVSVATIHDYLSKISKCSWVLQECCERVPETLSAAKELIIFGLSMTDTRLNDVFEQHWMKMKEKDNSNLEDSSVDNNSAEEAFVFQNFVDLLKPEILSEEERKLVATRIKLLRFSDRLHTYQLILRCKKETTGAELSSATSSSSFTSSSCSDDEDLSRSFDREFYNLFRQQSTVTSAIQFARQGKYNAVRLLLTYHGSETLGYWLNVLDNFPETMLPSTYRDLLPECSVEGDVFPWEVHDIRDRDWCESEKFRHLLEDDDEQWKASLPAGSCDTLTGPILTAWYRDRVYQMERLSHIVDSPLDLIRLARQRNIKDLEDLYHQLLTLDILVYELGLENFDLDSLEKKTPLEKASLLVSDATEESFVGDMLHRVMPYLERSESFSTNSREALLSQLLSNLSNHSLTLPLKLFQYLRDEPYNIIAPTLEERIVLTLECLYTNGDISELEKAFLILGCLPDRSIITGSSHLDELNGRLAVLESELNAAVILRRHGQPKSLLYIHNNAHDLQTVQNLVLRIARATANKVPSVPESEWNQLLSDILDLQAQVFKCLPLELCYELYASTVLASGNLKIIRSAMKILCCSSGDRSRKQISFERSVFLVLQAAREYFDSAGSFTDPGIQNAKACLNLIIEENAEIQEEMDLIFSLQLLQDFGATFLPMQVRLCPDRMRLVESCLQGQPAAYRNQQKLLVLASKLRVCGTQERERKGRVLVRIAEAAFDAKDYTFCANICKILVNDEQSTGWEICQRLGQCTEFMELETRQHLVAFALLHCPTSNIQDLIKIRCDLEMEALQLDISRKVSSLEMNSGIAQEEEFVDALTSPSTPMKEFLPQWANKLQTTTNLLSKMADTDFWKNSLNLSFSETARDRVVAFDNSQLKKQGFPGFYSSLHPGCHQSLVTPSYIDVDDGSVTNGRKVEQLYLVQKLLQSALLEQEVECLESLVPINNVLVQCSQLVMTEDCCLGLSYLFALKNAAAAEQCFTSLAQSQLSLQIALYFYSLCEVIYKAPDAFAMLPEDVVRSALKGPPHSEECFNLVQKYKAKLENFVQTEKIKELDCGVNIDRFMKDSQYKQDSILGLAMCPEWDKVELALELGPLHGVSGHEVALTHAVSLLLTASCQLVTDHLADNRLSSLLQEDAQKVIERLEETVFPNLNGTNHQLMIAYYTVLQSVAEKTAIDGLLPKDHIKLIKKVKATSSAVDYKGLLRDPLLGVLRPALNKDSAANIVRLLKTLPQHLRSTLTPGQLYTEMMVNDFFYNCLGFSSENESALQFESLKPFWPKVTAPDLVQFVRTCLFSRKCAEQLSPSTRAEMILDVIGFCRQSQNGDSHQPALQTLQRWLSHLENTWGAIDPEEMNDGVKSFVVELDISCGEPDSFQSAFEKALADGTVPFTVIEANVETCEVSIPQLITKSFGIDVPQPGHDLIDILLSRIKNCVENDMTDPCWPSLLQDLAISSHLLPKSRLLAASLLQKVGETNSKDNLQMITEAVLGRPIDNNEVVDEPARYNLFSDFLQKAASKSDLSLVQQLLSCWPPFSNTVAEIHPHLQLIEKMVITESDDLLPYISKVLDDNDFEEDSVSKLVYHLETYSSGNPAVIWIALSTPYSDMHRVAVKLLADFKGEIVPAEIVKRTVELQLVPPLVATKVYPVWVESLLLLEDGTLVSETARQLKEGHFYPEAGLLLLAYSGVPQALRTFSASLFFAQQHTS